MQKINFKSINQTVKAVAYQNRIVNSDTLEDLQQDVYVELLEGGSLTPALSVDAVKKTTRRLIRRLQRKAGREVIGILEEPMAREDTMEDPAHKISWLGRIQKLRLEGHSLEDALKSTGITRWKYYTARNSEVDDS